MAAIERMTTAQLDLEASWWSEQTRELTERELDRWEAVDDELNARGFWDHDDERIRESVGSYR